MLNSKRISEADRQTGEQIDRQKNRLTARQASPSGVAAINQNKLYVDYKERNSSLLRFWLDLRYSKNADMCEQWATSTIVRCPTLKE
jgi:hypothetical protein